MSAISYHNTVQNLFPQKDSIIENSTAKKSTRNFYWYFRPIAIFFRLTGNLPLKNLHSKHSQDVQFGYCTIPVLYVFFLLGASLAALAYFYDWGAFVPLLHERDYAIMLIYLFLIIFRSLMCWGFTLTTSRDFAKLIRLLDEFDERRLDCFPDICAGERNLYKWTVVPMIFSIFCMSIMNAELIIFYIVIMHPQVPLYYYSLIAAFSILSTWQIAPSLLYTYFSYSIKSNFESINTTFTQMFALHEWYLDKDMDDITINITTKIRNIRALHGMMSDAVNLLNKCYGSYMMTSCGFLVVTSVMKLYIFLYVATNVYSILFGEMLCSVYLIFISHSIADEVSAFQKIYIFFNQIDLNQFSVIFLLCSTVYFVYHY